MAKVPFSALETRLGPWLLTGEVSTDSPRPRSSSGAPSRTANRCASPAAARARPLTLRSWRPGLPGPGRAALGRESERRAPRPQLLDELLRRAGSAAPPKGAVGPPNELERRLLFPLPHQRQTRGSSQAWEAIGAGDLGTQSPTESSTQAGAGRPFRLTLTTGLVSDACRCPLVSSLASLGKVPLFSQVLERFSGAVGWWY